MVLTQITSIAPRDQFNKIAVRVHFYEKKPQFNSGATVDVFIDHTDSYAEIRKRAIEVARQFFKDALAAEAVETPE